MENNASSPIKPEYDVIIAGANPAGLSAAIACARSGLETLLFDCGDTPGGIPSDVLVHGVCGLYLTSPDMIPRQANGGFALEFCERLMKSGGACGPLRAGPYDIMLQEPLLYSRFWEQLCAREKKLTIAWNTRLDEIIADDSLLHAVRFEGRPERVLSRVFVDTTPDASLAFLSGASCHENDSASAQQQAFVFSIEDFDMDAMDEEGRMNFSQNVVSGIRDGLISPQIGLVAMRFVSYAQMPPPFLGLYAEGDHFSAVNPEAMMRFQILGQNLATELQNHIRTGVPGFEKCRIEITSSFPGFRDNRRIVGRYTLTDEDVNAARDFEDAVCYSAWPNPANPALPIAQDPTAPIGRACGIPLRTLISNDFRNLFMAGRPISSTDPVPATLRVIGSCLAIGQAAGLAAAAAAHSPERTITHDSEPQAARLIRDAVMKGI